MSFRFNPYNNYFRNVRRSINTQAVQALRLQQRGRRAIRNRRRWRKYRLRRKQAWRRARPETRWSTPGQHTYGIYNSGVKRMPSIKIRRMRQRMYRRGQWLKQPQTLILFDYISSLNIIQRTAASPANLNLFGLPNATLKKPVLPSVAAQVWTPSKPVGTIVENTCPSVTNLTCQVPWVRIFKWNIILNASIKSNHANGTPVSHVRLLIWRVQMRDDKETPPNMPSFSLASQLQMPVTVTSPWKRGYAKYFRDRNMMIVVDKVFRITDSWPYINWKGSIKTFQTNGWATDTAPSTSNNNTEWNLVWWKGKTSALYATIYVTPAPFIVEQIPGTFTYDVRFTMSITAKPYVRPVTIAATDGNAQNPIAIPRNFVLVQGQDGQGIPEPPQEEAVEDGPTSSSSSSSISSEPSTPGLEGVSSTKEPE